MSSDEHDSGWERWSTGGSSKVLESYIAVEKVLQLWNDLLLEHLVWALLLAKEIHVAARFESCKILQSSGRV